MTSTFTRPGAARARPVRQLVIVIVAVVMSIPFLYMISASLMSAEDLAASPLRWIPSSLRPDNYSEAWTYLSTRTVLNTVFFAVAIVVGQLALTLTAGFAMAHLPVPGSRIMLAVLLVPNLVPAELTLIPVFVVTYKLGLLGSYAGMILPIMCQTAFGTLLFRQFFSELPAGLIDAAKIDGAGWTRILLAIAVPLAKPAIATYASITFLGAWNQYIWPQLVANDEAHRVLNVALAPLAVSKFSLSSPAVGMAASVISILPVAIVFVLAQRWFVKGIVGSGID